MAQAFICIQMHWSHHDERMDVATTLPKGITLQINAPQFVTNVVLYLSSRAMEIFDGIQDSI
jgi:hypothetical protein